MHIFRGSVLIKKQSIALLLMNKSVSVRHGGSIPVILKESLHNKGEAGDIVQVKRGFMRNFLIPRKLAGVSVSPSNSLYIYICACVCVRERERLI